MDSEKVQQIKPVYNECDTKFQLLEDIQSQVEVIKNMLMALEVKVSNLDKRISKYGVNDPRRYMHDLQLRKTAKFLLDKGRDDRGCYAPFLNKTALLELSCRTAVEQFGVDGLYLEFGVASGKTINHLATLFPEITFYGFDSFEGLPEDWRPEFKKGTFKCAIPEVNTNVHLIPGLYNYTIPPFAATHRDRVVFINIDCDLYSSTRTIFHILGERMGEGTVIFFDELLGYIGFEHGELAAFNEFVTYFDIKYKILGYGIEQLAIQIVSINV